MLDSDALWTYALKAVTARALSTGEMREKLRTRAERAEDIDATLSRLKEYGFLNDVKFAEAFATSRLENGGLGKARALRDLRQRRVAPKLAEKTVEGVYEKVEEIALIDAYVRRKYRAAKREILFQTDKDLASAFRRLRMAGFGSGNVIRALKRFAANPELLDQIDESDTDGPAAE
jgi:regulatory protein